MAAAKVARFESAAIPLPAENVDTDQIVPARYLKVTDKAGLAEALFHDWRFEADGRRKEPPFVIDDPVPEVDYLEDIPLLEAALAAVARGERPGGPRSDRHPT